MSEMRHVSGIADAGTWDRALAAYRVVLDAADRVRRRIVLTAEKNTASTENKLIKKTVWSKAMTTVSATALQLCGNSICFWLKPAADKTALKRVADRATPMAPPVRAAVATMPEAEPTRSIGTAPRIALWFGELTSAQPSP